MRFLLPFFLLAALPAVAQPTAKIYDFSNASAPPLAAAYTAPGGVTAKVDVEVRNGALHFLNRAGGSFGVKFGLPPFDAEEFPTLAFDYTRSPDAKINFFIKVNGAFYGVVFSGPPKVRSGSFLLGTLPNVGTRGRAVIPLRDWLRRFQPKTEKLHVEEILAGNWDNEGYLLAGIGGNGPGAAWSLDNLSLTPDTKAPLQAGTPRFEGNALVWPLQGGSLDTRNAVLDVDGRKFDFASPFVRLETSFSGSAPARRVVFEAGDAGLAFKDGQNVEISLGNARGAASFQLAGHNAVVPLPRLKWEGAAAPDADFETDTNGWAGGAALVGRDTENRASGISSLQWANPRTAAPFDAAFSAEPLDVAQFPVLTFRYRADSRLRSDLRLVWNSVPYSIQFLDRDTPEKRLGTIENVVADGKWRLATIPLLEWMKKSRPEATDFKVSNFSFADGGWMGNAQGVKWNLDDFRFAPRVAGSIRAQVSLRDVSGIGVVSSALDQNPDTIPDANSNGGAQLEIPLGGRAAGIYWLHIRAQNGAGKWSETAHFPVFATQD